MAKLPFNLKQIALFLERLPGIGEKTANRLAFYFLRIPSNDLKEFAENVSNVKSKTKLCKTCLNVTENEICEICEDTKRDRGQITVVEEVLDLISFETGDIYYGAYHILHGKIDPLNRVTADDIYINALLKRIEKEKKHIKEIILATNPDMEGEATAMYIRNKLVEIKKKLKLKFKITRLGYGLPIGANLEYADYMTLRKSLENRNSF